MSVEEVVEAMSKFLIDSLSDEWTDSIWDHEFMDINDLPLPLDYGLFLENNNGDVAGFLLAANMSIKTWMLASQDADDGWPTLEQHNVQSKKVLPLICYLIANGLANPADEDWRQITLGATSLYFNLLMIPGSNAFNIFHQNLFSRALSSFRLGIRLNFASPNKKKTGRNKGNKQNLQAPLEDNSFITTSFDESQPLSNQERISLLKGLNSILHDLLVLLKSFSFKSQQDSLEHIIQRMVDVTRLEVSTTLFRFGRGAPTAQASIFSLAYNAYIVIGSLCNSFHGIVQDTVILVTQYLLPSIMMIPAIGTEPTPKDLTTIKDHTVHFLQYLMLILKDEAYKGISILIQHLCTKTQDRADFRQKSSQVVVDLMRCLPINAYSQLVFWFFKFAYNDKACHRLFAVEVIAKLLYEIERHGEPRADGSNELNANGESRGDDDAHSQSSQSSETDGQEDPITPSQQENARAMNSNLQKDIPSHRFLLAVIIRRCCDSSGTVRTKALATLAECTMTNNKGIRNLIEEIFVMPYLDVQDIYDSHQIENKFLSYKSFIKLLDNPEGSDDDPLPGAKAILGMLGDRIHDDKVFVRKAALQVIEQLMRFSRKCMTHTLLKTMCEFCRDPAVMVRKYMIQTVTDLMVTYPDHPTLPNLWVEHVLPRIVDPESTVQEKVLESLQKTVLDRLIAFNQMTRAVDCLPWILLVEIMKSDMRTHLYNACAIWEKSGILKQHHVVRIQTHIGTVNNIPAWVMLAAIGEYMDFKDPTFVVDAYKDALASENVQVLLCGLILEVLTTNWLAVSPAVRESVYTDLLTRLGNFQVHTQLIRPAVDLLLATPPFPNNPECNVDRWAPRIAEAAEKKIQDKSEALFSGTMNGHAINRFLQVLLTYGDVIQLCPKKLKEGTYYHLKKMLTDLKPSAELETEGFRAAVVVVIGKLCLTSEDVAKLAMPFLQELLQQPCPSAMKVNIICIMSDMCIKCTSLVEPILSDICLALRDNDTVVREKTLVALIQLLQEDYLKIRTDLFYHILSMLCDANSNIQNMASYYVTECLLTKHPNFAYQHFLQALFYYNNYEGHEKYSQIKQKQQDFEQCSLNKDERRLVYRFMLDNMNDIQRFEITHNLCVEILNGVIEGTVSLEGAGHPLLQDTFYALSSEEIRQSTLRARGDDEPPVNEAEMAAIILVSTRKTIVSQVMKKAVIENIVPIITQLKHLLESQKSALLLDLMVYLRDLMKDYKNEIKEIFAQDKQLAAEILYDLKVLEDNEKAEKRRKLKEVQTRLSDSSETEYESTSTTPVASPGRPTVPLEVRPALSGLTPQVRRNVEPFLAQACEAVKFIARVSGTPANLNQDATGNRRAALLEDSSSSQSGSRSKRASSSRSPMLEEPPYKLADGSIAAQLRQSQVRLERVMDERGNAVAARSAAQPRQSLADGNVAAQLRQSQMRLERLTDESRDAVAAGSVAQPNQSLADGNVAAQSRQSQVRLTDESGDAVAAGNAAQPSQSLADGNVAAQSRQSQVRLTDESGDAVAAGSVAQPSQSLADGNVAAQSRQSQVRRERVGAVAGSVDQPSQSSECTVAVSTPVRSKPPEFHFDGDISCIKSAKHSLCTKNKARKEDVVEEEDESDEVDSEEDESDEVDSEEDESDEVDSEEDESDSG